MQTETSTSPAGTPIWIPVRPAPLRFGRIRSVFVKALDAKIILLLGLCNGTGWATTLNGRPTVLLGIEKIVALHWFSEHLSAIAQRFAAESPHLTRETQRYFGERASFEGHPDVGYYLGARFVRFLMENMTFDEVLRLPLSQIQQSFDFFCASL